MKGWESKCQFDFQPLKVRNYLDLLACKSRAIYGKLSMNVTTFFHTSTQSKVFTISYGPPKWQESEFWEFRDSQLGSHKSLGTKWHLGATPVARHKEYYKWENGGFPQVWVVMSFLIHVWMCDTPLNSLMDSIASLKVKKQKEKELEHTP